MKHWICQIKPKVLSVLVCCGAVLLSGCASSPDVHYYHLNQEIDPSELSGYELNDADWSLTSESFSAFSASPHPWVLGRVTLPEYIDRDALVVRSGKAGLQVWAWQKWSENLGQGVERVLVSDLNRLQTQPQVYGWNTLPASADAFVWSLQLTQWDVQWQELFEPARAQGRSSVRLAASWTLKRPDALISSDSNQAARAGCAWHQARGSWEVPLDRLSAQPTQIDRAQAQVQAMRVSLRLLAQRMALDAHQWLDSCLDR